MGFLDSIGSAFKSVVSGLSKVADVVAPICAFIPGLNPVVTAIAAGIKAVDGLTDNPPNLGKMFQGVMGMLPGGALGNVLGPLSEMGGATSGGIAGMLTDAMAGSGGGSGGLLGDVLGKVLGNSQIGGADSALGGMATGLFDSLSTRIQSSGFQSDLASLLNQLTQTQPSDKLSADQVAGALTYPIGNTVERNIDGNVQQVPEYAVHPDFMKMIENAVSQIIAEATRSASSFQAPVAAPVKLDSPNGGVSVSGNNTLSSDVQAQRRRNYEV